MGGRTQAPLLVVNRPGRYRREYSSFIAKSSLFFFVTIQTVRIGRNEPGGSKPVGCCHLPTDQYRKDIDSIQRPSTKTDHYSP